MSTPPLTPLITPGLDALSSLIKNEAKACGVEVRLGGHGHQDIHTLLLEMHNLRAKSFEMEIALKEILEYIHAQNVREEFYGYCASCLLKARVNWELKWKN